MDDTTAQQPFNPSQPNMGQSNSAPASAINQPATNNEPTLSYVDNYAPPSQSSMPPQMPPAQMPPTQPQMTQPAMNQPPTMQPPMSQPAMPPLETVAADDPEPTTLLAEPAGQSLEEQNIFEMLGAGQASDEEKEAFLDELQQVIWEDFLENDVELLITDAEKVELKQIQDKTYPSDLEKQEAIVVFLEKLIPDLEDIMLEKALELKRDMFMERLAGMRDSLVGQDDKLAAINPIENLVSQDKWGEAVAALNKLG